MRTGLRTEIILSISLLLAAALLFAGFLLVKLTERNLLDQQRAHAANIINLVVADAEFTVPSERGENLMGGDASSPGRLQTILGKQTDILAWRLLDSQLQVLGSTTYQPVGEVSKISPSLLERGELFEELAYQSFQFFNSDQPQNYLDLSAPLRVGNNPYGLLQIRFSLSGLQGRVKAALQLVVIYVVIYGLVLAVFGVYLLNRNVVKPVRQLHQATTSVASGTLASVAVPSGPGEIHELAGSFNQMIEALAASRAETEAHIASDLVDSLKNFTGAVMNGNYLISDELGISSSTGGYQFQTHLYTDNSTQEEIYNYNNLNPTYSYVFTRGNPLAGADSYLWTNAGEQNLGVNSVYFVYDINDNLPGVSANHGRRVYLGYHMNGTYANSETSKSFPFLHPEHLVPFLSLKDEVDETTPIRQFIQWLRRQTPKA